MSEQLEVVSVEMVVDGELVYCFNDVLSVDDKLLRAYHRSMRTAAGE